VRIGWGVVLRPGIGIGIVVGFGGGCVCVCGCGYVCSKVNTVVGSGKILCYWAERCRVKRRRGVR
jgi:hypothetical protein